MIELSDRELDALVAEKVLNLSVEWRDDSHTRWTCECVTVSDGEKSQVSHDRSVEECDACADTRPSVHRWPVGNGKTLSSFSTDHNAAYDVTLKAIERFGWEDYMLELWDLVAFRPRGDRSAEIHYCESTMRRLVCATPRERCLAALKCAEARTEATTSEVETGSPSAFIALWEAIGCLDATLQEE